MFDINHEGDGMGQNLFEVKGVEDLPTPLAEAAVRLRRNCEEDQILAMLFNMRDVVECSLRLLAASGLAELFASAGNDVENLRNISAPHLSRILGKTPSLGDWVSTVRELAQSDKLPLLNGALRNIVNRNAWNLLFEGGNNFVTFRNETIGHGAYMSEAAIAEKVRPHLDPLNRFVEDARNALWSHAEIFAAGTTWKGSSPNQESVSRTNELWRPAYLKIDQATLSLDPLVRVHADQEQGRWDLLLFNYMKCKGKPESALASFLDYICGRPQIEKPFYPVAERYFRFDSIQYRKDSVPIERGERETFVTENNIPIPYLAKELATLANKAFSRDHAGAYLRLIGPAGAGKSYFLRKLKDFAPSTEDPQYIRESLLHAHCIRFYHSIAAHGDSPELFWHNLTQQAKRHMLCVTDGESKRSITDEQVVADCRDLGSWVRELFRLNQPRFSRNYLFIAIDGLDEIPEKTDRDRRLTSWLTVLPPRACVLLVSREQLRRSVQRDILHLEQREHKGKRGVDVIELNPTSSDNLEIQRWYLQQKFEVLTEKQVNDILCASGGVFLYTRYFAHVLEGKIVEAGVPLPSKEELFNFLLDDLRKRAGEEVYNSLHRRLLAALLAAREPQTASSLAEYWRLPMDRLESALKDLEFLLAIGRNDVEENVYSICHLLLKDALMTSPAMKDAIRVAHLDYVLPVCERQWLGDDAAIDPDCAYALLHVPYHLREAGRSEKADAWLADSAYRAALVKAARAFVKCTRFAKAEEFWRAALSLPVQSGDSVAEDLALDTTIEYAEHLNLLSRGKEAARHANKAAGVAAQRGDRIREGLALSAAGFAEGLQDHYRKAHSYLSSAKTALMNSPDVHHRSVVLVDLRIAEILYYQNKIQASLDICDALLAAGGFEEDPDLPVRIEHLRIRLYTELKEWALARTSCGAALEQARQLGLEECVTDICNFGSTAYLELGLVDEAKEMAKEALNNYMRYNDSLGCSEACWGIGDIYFKNNQMDQALHWYKEELRYSDDVAVVPSVYPYLHLAEVYIRTGQLEDAREMFSKAKNIADQSEYKDDCKELNETAKKLDAALQKGLQSES